MVEVDGHSGRDVIIVRSIPHARQRYETVGDYSTADGCTTVLVSDMGNRDYEFLVAIHELVESHLCQKRGITDEEITEFDVAFEARRKPGDEREPGDDPASPYRDEHCMATAVERLVCGALGISWYDYEQAVLGLSQ